jgi:hypothetical protein
MVPPRRLGGGLWFLRPMYGHGGIGLDEVSIENGLCFFALD